MNVPALRFPEFEGEWEERRLGSVVDIVTSGSRDWAQYYSRVGAKFIRMTNIPRDGIRLLLSDLKYVALPSHGSEGSRTSLQGGDILISITAELGKIGIIPDDLGEAYINQHTALVRPNKKKAVPDLLAQLLAMKSSNRRLNRLNDSGAKAGLNLGTIRAFKVTVPSLPEQKKIAAFLGVVDAKITALRDRHAGLERYKRGLMQALFSQRLRFTKPDGTAFPDWQEKRLGDVAKIYDGTHQTPNYVADGVPFFSVEQVTANNFERTKFIAEDVFKKESKRVILERDDILMTRIGDIGTCRLIDWDVRASFYVSLALVKCDKAVNSSFLNQFMSSVLFQRELWKRTIHVAFPKKINLGEVGNCMVQLPHTDEQSKIAEALSAMDAKIAAVSGQLDRMQAFKKGLLQQMFV